MFSSRAGRTSAVMRPRMTAKWVPNLVEKCRRPSWGKDVPGGRKKRPTKLSRSGKQAGLAGGVTRGRQTKSKRDVGKDVPQFAPNFSVYLLPPDIVCLYSEDRKFFLHGELYCALASAIAKGRKELFGSSFASWSGDFPSRQNPKKL